jgi:flagellar biogenesis protein FliO
LGLCPSLPYIVPQNAQFVNMKKEILKLVSKIIELIGLISFAVYFINAFLKGGISL